MIRAQITYQPNPHYVDGDERVPRLYASVGLRRYGIEETVQQLPIYFRNLPKPIGPILQTYSTWIAGLFLEKGNLGSLEKSLDLYLGALVHFGRLPEHVFRLGDKAWPIYRLPDQLVTRYPGNPVLGAATIGELRIALADYFKTAGLIHNRKEVEILLVSRYDLQLYPPVCALRADGVPDILVFPVQSGQGMNLIAPLSTTSITVPCDHGSGILELHQAVSEHLIQEGVLGTSAALTVRKLTDETWRNVRVTLQPYCNSLAYYDDQDGRLIKRNVPVFANGKYLVAARGNHLARTALYVAPDIWELQSQLGHELYFEGKLSSPDYVTVSR